MLAACIGLIRFARDDTGASRNWRQNNDGITGAAAFGRCVCVSAEIPNPAWSRLIISVGFSFVLMLTRSRDFAAMQII